MGDQVNPLYLYQQEAHNPFPLCLKMFFIYVSTSVKVHDSLPGVIAHVTYEPALRYYTLASEAT